MTKENRANKFCASYELSRRTGSPNGWVPESVRKYGLWNALVSTSKLTLSRIPGYTYKELLLILSYFYKRKYYTYVHAHTRIKALTQARNEHTYTYTQRHLHKEAQHAHMQMEHTSTCAKTSRLLDDILSTMTGRVKLSSKSVFNGKYSV